MTKIELSHMIYCMINTSNLGSALAEKFCTIGDELPVYVKVGDHVIEVEAVTIDENTEGTGYAVHLTLNERFSNVLSNDLNSDTSDPTYPTKAEDPETPDSLTPGDSPDQVPASGGIGQISSNTGPEARRQW